MKILQPILVALMKNEVTKICNKPGIVNLQNLGQEPWPTASVAPLSYLLTLFFVKLQESPVGSAESSGSGFSPLVGQSRPMDLGSAAVRQELTSSSTCGSAPTSPKTMAGAMSALASSPMQAVQTHPLNLASGLQRPSHHNVELLRSASSGSINSRSLPNIPSAMGRPGAGGLGSKVYKFTDKIFFDNSY